MPLLTVEERAKIAARYEVWGSVVRVQRWWRAERGIHATLDAKTVKNCHSKLLTTGSVADARRSGRPSTSRTAENVDRVREMFMRSPKKSLRQGSRESGLSRYSVATILKKDLSFKPWKPHYVQQLFPDDCDRRMEFGEIFLSWNEDWPELFENILWTDEAVFHIGGFVNRHNSHYWASVNPNECVEKAQGRPKVTVWCGITSSQVVGPFFLRNTMNGERYLEMLQDRVWPVISQWNNPQLHFMQDGAPAHFANDVREWLHDHFPGRWIGRRGAHEWPARSPDLTPCDFFLWGWAKEEVYKRKPRNLDELEAVITDVLANVPPNMLQASVSNVPVRLRKCVENAGAYVEI